MSIDLSHEIPIPLSQVPRLSWIPRCREGKRLHVATVHRWCTRGLRGRRLEYLQLGGTRVTSEAALMRFFEALTMSSDVATALNLGKAPATPQSVERQLDAILGKLK